MRIYIIAGVMIWVLSLYVVPTAWAQTIPPGTLPPAQTYLPIAANGEAVVTAITGHGEQINITKDWALIKCENNQTPKVEQVDQTLVVKC